MAISALRVLVKTPEVNPVNTKARSIPVFNPVDRYGRVFFFSWLGFMVAFLSWYAFPPLMTITIREDLNMTQADVANSNIVALLATLLVRLVSGPLCDRFGPRYVFAGTLLCGAIPTALVGPVKSPAGLMALRFFVGILGGTFVPCQVWCMGFFDNNVIGTANGLSSGWGNGGGGITYFVMPAVFDSLVRSRGLSPHVAWRVSFVVPFVLIVATAAGMLLLCDDTPTGRWADRDLGEKDPVSPPPESLDQTLVSAEEGHHEKKKRASDDHSLERGTATVFGVPKAKGVAMPGLMEGLSILSSKHSLALAIPYACAFGSQLAINSIIGAYYYHAFPSLGQTASGNWAAMFGLLNVPFRPAGGIVGDLIYRRTGSVAGKKLLAAFLGVGMGVFQLALGLANPKDQGAMFGLVAAMAFFMNAACGAIFAVVPHVFPHANGTLSGFIGAAGNFGGIICAIIFRYNGESYHTAMWIIGAVSIALNLAVGWIRPMPKA